MLEIAPGVYTQPDMSAGVRERVWSVLAGWWETFRQGSIVMTWATPNLAERQGVLVLGEPPKELVEYDGLYIVRRNPNN
jgi:CRISPR-associated protein Cas2